MNMIILGVMLTIINPVIEEWFWRVFLYECFKRREFEKWLVSAFYASYHFVTFEFYSGELLVALISVIGIWILGRIFVFIKEHFGFLTAVLFHVGVDAGVCLSSYLIMLEWPPVRNA